MLGEGTCLIYGFTVYEPLREIKSCWLGTRSPNPSIYLLKLFIILFFNFSSCSSNFIGKFIHLEQVHFLFGLLYIKTSTIIFINKNLVTFFKKSSKICQLFLNYFIQCCRGRINK